METIIRDAIAAFLGKPWEKHSDPSARLEGDLAGQNFYNIARREDDALVDLTARQGIAYVPYFP